MSLLPRFVVLLSKGRYLSVTENLPSSLPSGFVKFDEPNIWNPRVKFAVEPAKTGDGQLVHLRSCYNNKYLVAEKIQNNKWIVASSKKPEEDQSKPPCTFFKPFLSFAGETSGVCLRPAHFLIFATHSLVPSDTQHGLLVSYLLYDSSAAMLNAIDWETLVILPSHVSFRSEELHGNYLCSRVVDRWYPYQRFESGLDVGDPRVAKDLFPTPDGNYRIRDLYFGKFWRRSPNWIWADAEENNNSNDTLFSFIKISNDVLALRNLGNNNFCGALTTEGKTNCLNAHYPTMSRQTRLKVEERVLERNISDVKYRLSDSRIYEEKIQEVSHSFATNDSPKHDASITLTYSMSDSRTTHWSNSVSITSSVSVKFETNVIPFISKADVEVSTELGYEYEWGESKTTTRTRESSYVVVVPPLTKIKVTLMSTKGACDVPFSYTQRDLLTTGERVTTIKDDGIYNGINSYNFYFQSSVVTTNSDEFRLEVGRSWDLFNFLKFIRRHLKEKFRTYF